MKNRKIFKSVLAITFLTLLLLNSLFKFKLFNYFLSFFFEQLIIKISPKHTQLFCIYSTKTQKKNPIHSNFIKESIVDRVYCNLLNTFITQYFQKFKLLVVNKKPTRQTSKNKIRKFYKSRCCFVLLFPWLGNKNDIQKFK